MCELVLTFVLGKYLLLTIPFISHHTCLEVEGVQTFSLARLLILTHFLVYRIDCIVRRFSMDRLKFMLNTDKK
jgi:hypothetical protein